MPSIYGAGGSSGAASVTPSVVVAQAAPGGASVNVSTEGTIDWMTFSAPTVLETQMKYDWPRRKIYGEDDMVRSFLTFRSTNFGAGSGSFSVTTSATDDAHSAGALAANTNDFGVWHTSNTDFGMRWSARAMTTQRVMRIYCAQYAGAMTCTATLSDGTTHSAATTQSAGTTTRLYTITYNASSDGQMLRVSLTFPTNLGSGSIRLAAVTLAAS
jgi:hypothetical protein